MASRRPTFSRAAVALFLWQSALRLAPPRREGGVGFDENYGQYDSAAPNLEQSCDFNDLCGFAIVKFDLIMSNAWHALRIVHSQACLLFFQIKLGEVVA